MSFQKNSEYILAGKILQMPLSHNKQSSYLYLATSNKRTYLIFCLANTVLHKRAGTTSAITKSGSTESSDSFDFLQRARVH